MIYILVVIYASLYMYFLRRRTCTPTLYATESHILTKLVIITPTFIEGLSFS